MVNQMIGFFKKTPSVFHAIKNFSDMLDEAGFTALKESEAWTLKKGGKYYVTRNNSSVIAFKVPKKAFSGLLITASHCDSPVFKIKEFAEVEVRGKYIQLDTEKYGGPILTSWLDRPLSFAGRVLVKTDKGIETRLIDAGKPCLIIPNVAPHLKRDINDGMKYNLMTDMFPLFGDIAARGGFKKLVAELAGTTEENILGHDLFLYGTAEPTVWGPNDEFISAERLDDLECAYTTAQGFLAASPKGGMPVLAIFDNEEVGSTTKQGANSTFLTDTLTRVCESLGMTREEFLRAQSCSVMLSCDNAHAVHPNHPELFDAVNNCEMNKGIVIKEAANQKYTSDGVSKAMFRFILDRAGVPVQYFANRSDMVGGGTLGNIANTHYSLNTVDIGLAQLSMHSVYETAGTRDVQYMIDGAKAFYEADIKAIQDGAYNI